MQHASRLLPSLLCAVLAAGLALALMAPRAQAAPPTVLLLHGGGWLSGSSSQMIPWQQDFAARGYRALRVAYPLGDVTAAIDHVDAIAAAERYRGRKVIAYGLSAGGTIAAALAAAGRVDGAVNVNGPTDFTRWITGLPIMLAVGMSEREKRAASPYRRLSGRQTPQLLQCGWADPLTTYDQCTRYVVAAAAGNRDTTLHAVLNAHAQGPAERDRARAWVQQRWPAAGSSSLRKAPRAPRSRRA